MDSLVGWPKIDPFSNMWSELDKAVRVIDFDYFDPSKILISVTSSQTIELDLTELLESIADEAVWDFRSFYDYTYLSASVPGTHPLYAPILARLSSIFRRIEDTVLVPLTNYLKPSQLKDIPMEVLVRCPDVDAVSFNLLDLQGNAFAHRVSEWREFPSLIKSNGVYWPDRN